MLDQPVSGKFAPKLPSKSLSQAELEDRWKKGLCFWFELKYAPGHKCSKSQLYQLVVEPSWENEHEIRSPSPDDFHDCDEQLELTETLPGNAAPVLSLQALQGLQGPTTMRFPTVIDQSQVVALVDSGSTHNFIDFKVAKRLNLAIEAGPNLKVLVANGVKLCTQGLCRLLYGRHKDISALQIF